MAANALDVFNVLLILLYGTVVVFRSVIARRVGERSTSLWEMAAWAGFAFAMCSLIIKGEIFTITGALRNVNEGVFLLQKGQPEYAHTIGFDLAVRELTDSQRRLIENGMLLFFWGYIAATQIEGLRRKLRDAPPPPKTETATASA